MSISDIRTRSHLIGCASLRLVEFPGAFPSQPDLALRRLSSLLDEDPYDDHAALFLRYDVERAGNSIPSSHAHFPDRTVEVLDVRSTDPRRPKFIDQSTDACETRTHVFRERFKLRINIVQSGYPPSHLLSSCIGSLRFLWCGGPIISLICDRTSRSCKMARRLVRLVWIARSRRTAKPDTRQLQRNRFSQHASCDLQEHAVSLIRFMVHCIAGLENRLNQITILN